MKQRQKKNLKKTKSKIRKDFLWALGPTALHEMTTTEFGEKPEEMELTRLINTFKTHYTPIRNIHHSRGDFFFGQSKRRAKLRNNTGKNYVRLKKNANLKTLHRENSWSQNL